MKYKYIMGKSRSPYENLAQEQMLMNHMEKDCVIIFLWQNDHTVVVGRNQEVYAECRVEKFLSDGGIIARRKSGGGAVYHDFGNLCFSIISAADRTGACDYRELILHTLSAIGIAAAFNGRNDLVACGRKFSGNAVYRKGDTVCQHGTILVDSDLEKMNAYLTPEACKLKRNAVASVRSRVINLTEVLPDLTVESFCRAFVEAYGMEQFVYTQDLAELKRLADAYADEEWVYRGKMR